MRSTKSSRAEQATRQQIRLLWDIPGLLVAGVDEAGRGPLAGPVVAAAVILDELKPIKGLADSKQLSALRRERLFDEIRAKALCCSIAEASVGEIEQLNILQATLLAMRRAVEGLPLQSRQAVAIDQDQFRFQAQARAIIKGDALVPAISAASILAKVYRDRWCADYDLQYPQYGFASHKGYGTAAHLAALAAHGPCPQHRKTFRPVTDLLREVLP